jgi:hypothetical protein
MSATCCPGTRSRNRGPTVLAVLGHLAAIRRDYAGASKLLDEGQALVQELRDEDLAGYDHLQHLLTVVLVQPVPLLRRALEPLDEAMAIR